MMGKETLSSEDPGKRLPVREGNIELDEGIFGPGAKCSPPGPLDLALGLSPNYTPLLATPHTNPALHSP